MKAMREAVIVSTARTALAKSVRGTFNDTHGITLAAHALEHAIARAGVAPEEVEDVILGCAHPEGATGYNIARNAAVAAGCPVMTSGTTINRYCSSGLQAIAVAAGRVIVEGVPVLAAELGDLSGLYGAAALVLLGLRVEPTLETLE